MVGDVGAGPGVIAGITAAPEIMFLTRAVVSSLLATVADGIAYQTALTIAPGRYGWAALWGAAAGGILNFLLNRHWTFRAADRPFWAQAANYAVGALLTFASLRAFLWLLIEKFGMGERIAWLPAEFLGFVFVTYPLQRFVVFAPGGRSFLPLLATGALIRRLRAHITGLWPRQAWLPAAPFWAWIVFWAVRDRVRWEHVLMAVGVSVLAYGNRGTKRLYFGLLPILLVGLVYDAMRFVQNVGLTVDNVHLCDLRGLEMRWFGTTMDGVRVTWHDWLQPRATPALDLFCAIPYGIFLYVVVAYALFLFIRNLPAQQRFVWGFFVLNLAGYLTYHIYPAGPPWYYHSHGCVIDLATRSSPGPNLTRVDAMMGFGYFAGFYGRGSDVFGAMPSLHVAYPLQMIIEGWAFHRAFGRFMLVAFYLSMCFAAVYLDHHWVLDLIAGSLGAVVVSVLFRVVPNRIRRA